MKGIPLPVVLVGLLVLANIISSLELDADFLEDLPFFLAIAAFILFRVMSAQTEKKRRGPVPMPMPMPEPSSNERPKDLGFKIPPLKGAPKPAEAEADLLAAERDAEELRRQQSLKRHMAEKKAREEKKEEERLRREHQSRELQPLQRAPRSAGRFSPDALRTAVIWSEVLAPPKALRRR